MRYHPSIRGQVDTENREWAQTSHHHNSSRRLSLDGTSIVSAESLTAIALIVVAVSFRTVPTMLLWLKIESSLNAVK